MTPPRLAARDLPAVRLVLLRLPAFEQGLQHAHRLYDFGVADRLLGLCVGPRLCASGGRQRLAGDVLVEQRQREQHDPAAQRQPTQPRVHEEDGGEEKRCPRRVEDRVDARAGEETPHLVEVTQWSRVSSDRGRRRRVRPMRSAEPGPAARSSTRRRWPASVPAPPPAPPSSTSAPAAISDSITSVSRLWLRQHAVVDLEHVERPGQHQHVDAGAEPDQWLDGPAGLFHHHL